MTTETPDKSSALLPVFLILAVVFGVSALVRNGMESVVRRAENDTATQHAIIDDFQRTLSTMKDAETGQRGFLLTGDESYLKPNLDAKTAIQKNLANLDSFVRAGKLAAGPVDAYHELADAKLAELDETVQARRMQGFDAAVAIVRNNTGKQLMDRMRTLTDQMVNDREGTLDADRETEQRLSWISTVLVWLVVLLNIGTLAWAYRRIRNEIALREAAALEKYRQGELLQVTLASIGDGVIVTDLNGRITFFNEVAGHLCGWSQKEAIGLPCEKVFAIVNEMTRQSVESPVEKVLRSGIIVGLANHTILIRKDGTEIPIDDSGAPIRDRDGSLRGVVLVFRDFSEHKHAEDALRLAVDEAQAANVAKNNFLATLSHELRTPLTPVVMTLASWIEAENPPADWRNDLRMMQRNLELEARLIDDLLDLTRIVRGKLSLNETVADVNELLDAVAGMYQSEILSKGLTLSLDFKAARHHVYVDPARLQQVFLNVLKNATKFTPDGGAIEIRTESNDGHVSVSISDTGIGMTGEMQSRLFRPFEQGTGDVIRRYGGLGLGMAISKALMEAQGGSISASSEGLGHGSTFSMEIPLVDGENGVAHTVRAASEPADLRTFDILVVEDHVDTARALARLLAREGHNVTQAHSMAEAMEHLEQRKYDLMLSDIGLPDGTGLDLIRKARVLSDLPAVALTGFGMEEDVLNCREAGFNEHLTKPINYQKLKLIIHELMQDRATTIN